MITIRNALSRTRVSKLFILLCLFGVNSSQALDAPAALVPPGLVPGDTFFVVFATSGKIQGDRPGFTDYTTFATAQASAGTLTSGVAGWLPFIGFDNGAGGIFLTTSTSFAGVVNRPIYTTTGVKIADDRADMFDGTLDSPINFDQDGVAVSANVYTGFKVDGSLNSTPTNIALGPRIGVGVGLSSASDATWAELASSLGTESIYVLSPLLTVPAAPGANASAADW